MHKAAELYAKSTDHPEQLPALTLAFVGDVLAPALDEKELGVLNRGRNAKGIVPKNAKAWDYRRATAVEALVGYWYLIDDAARLKWAFDTLWAMTEGENDEQSR